MRISFNQSAVEKLGGCQKWQSSYKKKGVSAFMKNNKLQPLSEIEKHLAEENHDLVYSFLHRHEYSIEEFYNIAIFGLLKGIQNYCRRKDLQEKYQLAFICEQYMRAEIKDYFRTQNRQKRKPTEIIISLDANYVEEENLYNCTGGKSAEDEIMETEELLNLLENFTESQRNILKLKLEGYDNKEIYIELGIKPSTFYKEINRIKVQLENWKGGKYNV